MPVPFYNDIDMLGRKLQNGLIDARSSAPTAYGDGQAYYNTSDNHFYIRKSGAWYQLDGQSVAGSLLSDVVGGRLTPTTATPYQTSAVSGATSIYYTPYTSNLISLWDGSGWVATAFSEITITVPSTIFRCFDIFAYLSGGAVTIELVNWNQTTGSITAATNATPVVATSTAHGLTTSDVIGITSMAGLTSLNGKLWTLSATATNTFTPASSAGNGTYTSGGTWYKMNNTRATALAYDDGRLIKSGDKTRRYLGTGCTTGTSGQLDFSLTRRWLWNMYNQKPVRMFTGESSSYSYASVLRQSNGSQANQLEILTGMTQEIEIHRQASLNITGNGTGLNTFTFGIGYDTTAVFEDTRARYSLVSSAATTFAIPLKKENLGLHLYTSLEECTSIHASSISIGLGTAFNNLQAGIWL